MNRFSPVAPARVRVQVVPVGKIERRRFNAVFSALGQHASVIKLGDIELRDDQQCLLSPKAYPKGSLLFSYCNSSPSIAEQQLSPYELFRGPQLVVGIAGGLSSEEEEQQSEELGKAAETLREHYPHAIHRHIFLLPEAEGGPLAHRDNITRIAKTDDDESGLALHDAVCEVAAHFLVELSTYAKATLASPTIQTPGQKSSTRPRAWSIRSDDDKVASGRSTPTQSAELSSPVGGDESSRPPSRGVRSPPPPTSFEQIRAANATPNAMARSDSRTSDSSRQGGRPGSQDRASIHGSVHTVTQSKSKARERGKARVSIVVGHIYAMAGQWEEALRMLADSANTARKQSDPLWHAKALEGIVVCMLLLASEGLEFTIPAICYPAAERSHSRHVQKLSVNLPSDFRPADAAHQASVRRLSTSLPDLLKQILTLYESGEGFLELPILMLSEVKIRFCNLMAMLYQSNNELSGQALTAIVTNDWNSLAKRPTGSGPSGSLSRTTIAAILNEALQADLETLTTSDCIAITMGAHNVYAALNMDRKKASVLKDAMAQLTAALHQARRLGAAEAGIHPAATLSADVGADVMAASATDNGGINDMISSIAHTYGINLLSADHSSLATAVATPSKFLSFGNDALKTELLKSIASFSEASPNPQGVLVAVTSLLMSVALSTVVDANGTPSGTGIQRDDQTHLATTLARTIVVSKHLGLTDVQAQFWDEFLVRGLTFAPRDAAHSLIPHSLTERAVQGTKQKAPGNPLLYDPNAARDSKAIQVRQIVIRNEPQRCSLTLQNPLEVPIEVESVQLITEGHKRMKLHTKDFNVITLEPLQLQQVPFSVLPSSIGEFKIVGCRVKIASCGEREFPIYSGPWAPAFEQLVKHQGLSVLKAADSVMNATKPKRMIVPATSAPTMPLLELESVSVPEGSLMLLNGERQVITIVLRNTSGVPAVIYRVEDVDGSMNLSRPGTFLTESNNGVLDEPKGAALVDAGETVVFNCSVTGHTGVSDVMLDIYYRPASYCGYDAFARVLSLPFSITVQNSLLLQDPRAFDVDDNTFLLTFSVTNAWCKPIGCRFEIRYPSTLQDVEQPELDGQLAPGETKTLSLLVHRDVFRPYKHDTHHELWELLWQKVIVSWQEWSEGDFRSGRVLLRDVRPLVLTDDLEHVLGRVLRTGHRISMAGPDAVPVGRFVRIRLLLQNCTTVPSPSLSMKFGVREGEDGSRVGFAGLRTRLVNPIPAGTTVFEEFVVCVTTPGRVNLVGVVKPAADPMDFRVWLRREEVPFDAIYM